MHKKLEYSLQAATVTGVYFEKNHLKFTITQSEIETLKNEVAISVERNIHLKNGTSLHLTIEKDLQRKSQKG